SNASFIPAPFPPPQPKQLFSGFGSRRMILLIPNRASDQRYPAALGSANTAFTLAHLRAENIRESCNTARDCFFVEAGEAKPQRIRLRPLDVKIPTGSKEHAALFCVNQKFASVEASRQFQPNAHASVRCGPSRALRHVLAKSFVQCPQARSINLPHPGKMLCEQSPAYEFGKGCLSKLIGVQVGGLLDEAESFHGSGRSNDPAHA